MEIIQKRQGLYIACIEEIAYNLGYINEDELNKIAESMNSTEYGKYLKTLTRSRYWGGVAPVD